MTLIAEELAAIAQVLGNTSPEMLTPVIAELRRRIPGLLCLRCDASDVLEDPYRSFADFDLHLVNTTNHCTEMTSDPLSATGILVAAKVAA